MRSHQAASWLSSAREKWTRPLVVGPSPVITPSRTTASACAAVFRQEIFEGSKATSETSDGSARAASGADIGSYSFQLLSTCSWPAFFRGRKRVVNDSKLAPRVF